MLDGMLGGLPHRTSEVMHGAAERARAGRTVAAARAQARLPLLVGLGAAGLWGGYSLHQRQDTSDRAFMAGTWALALLVGHASRSPLFKASAGGALAGHLGAMALGPAHVRIVDAPGDTVQVEFQKDGIIVDPGEGDVNVGIKEKPGGDGIVLEIETSPTEGEGSVTVEVDTKVIVDESDEPAG